MNEEIHALGRGFEASMFIGIISVGVIDAAAVSDEHDKRGLVFLAERRVCADGVQKAGVLHENQRAPTAHCCAGCYAEAFFFPRGGDVIKTIIFAKAFDKWHKPTIGNARCQVDVVFVEGIKNVCDHL